MITETENHLPSQQGAEDGLMMLLHSRSLILSTAVTVVLERNALLLDVVYKLYTTVLDRSRRGYVLVTLGGTLVHLAWKVCRTGTYALVSRHGLQEVSQRLLPQRCSGRAESRCAVVVGVEADGKWGTSNLCRKRNHPCLLIGVALLQAQAHAALYRKVAEHVLLASALVPVAGMTEFLLPSLCVAQLVVCL